MPKAAGNTLCWHVRPSFDMCDTPEEFCNGVSTRCLPRHVMPVLHAVQNCAVQCM